MQRKQLISESKLRVLEVGEEIADLTDKRSCLIDERACLKILILQEEYISDTWRKRLRHRIAQRIYEAKKKPRKDMLKAVMDG